MPEDLSRFLAFINDQLDLSGLSEPARLTDDEIEQFVMPLIRGDIHRETLRLVDQLLTRPQQDHWRGQLAPLHREIRQCLAPRISAIMQARYPGRLSADEWLDLATFIITVAWLVRQQMDGDEPLSLDNE